MKRPIVKRTPHETLVVYENGKISRKVRLYQTYMEKAEIGFRWATLFLAGGLIVLAFSSIAVESIGKAFAADLIEMPVKVETMPPILRRICKAESGGKHFDKSGKVTSHKNKDGTTDYGICQINSIHIEAAKKLGFDIMLEQDNLKFARHLFFTQGSVPWRASAYGKNGWINN